MQVVVRGILTHYEQSGSRGKQLLLLHGWGDRLETYDALVSALDSSYQVTRLDLPGFGATEPPKQSWGLSDYARFVADFSQKLSVKPDVLIGHSNGGAVAVVATANRDVRPKQLVLLASAGIRNRQKLQKLLWKAVAKTGKAMTFWLPLRYKQRLQKKLYGTIGSDMLVAPQLRETFKKTVAEDITSKAAELNIPTLLVYGGQDRATPPGAVGQQLHRAIKHSRLEIIPGADHFVHQQSVSQVATLVKEFIK